MKDKILSVKHSKHGVLYSEAFFLCSVIKDNDIDTIIESGTCYGVSTEYFAKCFPNKKIITVDKLVLEGSNTYDFAYERLKNFDNVKQITGDSFEIIPELTKTNKNICLFIDGPKGNLAIKLMNSALNSEVKIVAFHDFTSEQIEKVKPKNFEIIDYNSFLNIYGNPNHEQFLNKQSICSIENRYIMRENIVVMVRQ